MSDSTAPPRSPHAPGADALARRASRLAPGSGLVLDLGGNIGQLHPTPHRYGALVAARLAPDTVAAATVSEAASVTGDPLGSIVVSVATHRLKGSVVLATDCAGQHLELSEPRGPLVDVTRRALGLRCPSAEISVLRWLDVVFLERLAESRNTRDWGEVARCHPLSSRLPLTLEALQRRRRRAMHGLHWREVRSAVAARRLRARIEPSLAAWLDDGSFARWILAEHRRTFDWRSRLPEEISSMVADLLGYCSDTPSCDAGPDVNASASWARTASSRVRQS